METNHILIVEDDKEIREGVQIYLQSQWLSGVSGSGRSRRPGDHREGRDPSCHRRYHDARMDGIRMTMKLREKYDFPVIMLSAKSEEVDKITRA